MILLATMDVMSGGYTRNKVKNRDMAYGPFVVYETPETIGIAYRYVEGIITAYSCEGDSCYEQIDGIFCTDCYADFLEAYETYKSIYGECDTHYVDSEGFEVYGFLNKSIEIAYKDIYNFYMVFYYLEACDKAMSEFYDKEFKKRYGLEEEDENE
jgi:hypothetical protein